MGAITAIAAAAGALTLPLAVPIGLWALGFGARGIAAGSAAAAWMSSYGGAVAAGSALSIAQSVGAVGLSSAAVAGLSALGGAVAAGISRLV